jgi:hypothetical protein
MTCPDCEYHKSRAAHWRAEAYKQAGHDVIERPWVGLTDEEIKECFEITPDLYLPWHIYKRIEAKLKEKNT